MSKMRKKRRKKFLKVGDFYIYNGYRDVFCKNCNMRIPWTARKIFHNGNFYHYDKKCFKIEECKKLKEIGLLVTDQGKVSSVFEYLG